MMGLHCHDSIMPGQVDLDLSLDEIVERRKLFRSLYIRERCYATARGTLRRLPRYTSDSNPGASSRAMSQAESHAALALGHGQSPVESVSHLETHEPFFIMATIQDELYAAIFHGSSPDTRGMDQKMALSSIRQTLVAFAQTHRLPSLKRPQTFQDLSLHLAYFGTQIRAYELDDEHHVLDDARLCCLLVMSACSDENPLDAIAGKKLDSLLSRMADRNWCADNPAVLPGSTGGSNQSLAEVPNKKERKDSPRVPNKRCWPFGSETLASPNTQNLRNRRVLELLPTSAIFILARSILRVRRNAAHRFSAPSGSDFTANKTPDDEAFEVANEDFTVLCELSRVLGDSLDVSSETQNSYSSKLLRVTQTLVSFLREAVNNKPDQHSSPPSGSRQDTLDCSTRLGLSQDGMLNSSANSSAAEPSLLNLSALWESPQGSSALPVSFSPSFDLSSMNISTIPDSLFDFDFSQHFESVGGFMSPAEHLTDTEALKSVTEQEKRRKRLRLDCSQELDGPEDTLLSTWPQRNRATMARGSV